MKQKIICAACVLSALQVSDLNAVITRPSDVATGALSFSRNLAEQSIVAGLVSLTITAPVALLAIGVEYIRDATKGSKSAPSKKSTPKISSETKKVAKKSTKDSVIKEIGQKNTSHLLAFAESVGEFSNASVNTIKGFRQVKEMVVPKIKGEKGKDKKALESVVMTTDINVEYMKKVSESLSKVAKIIVDMRTSKLGLSREKAAKNMISELKTLAENLIQYLKLVLLNASYILQVDPSSEVSEKRSVEEFNVIEGGLVAIVEGMVAAIRELNPTEVSNKRFSECLELIKKCVTCLSDINKLMVSVFKYSTTLSEQGRRKTAQLMNQLNENYFSNKLSLTITEFLDEPSSSDNREDDNVSDHDEEASVGITEDNVDISFLAEVPEDSIAEQNLSFPAEAPSENS